jgi:hypothetical protein
MKTRTMCVQFEVSEVSTAVVTNSYTFCDMKLYRLLKNRLCGLVVRVLGYRSGGLGSIPGTTGKKC